MWVLKCCVSINAHFDDAGVQKLNALAAATIARFYRGWQANPTAGWPEIRKLAQQFDWKSLLES